MAKPAKQPFAYPPREPEVIGKTLKYGEGDEHLVRRLGNALVLHWDFIPDALQDLLIDQAAAVEDRVEGPHAAGDIEYFLRTAKVSPIRREASESGAPAAPERAAGRLSR